MDKMSEKTDASESSSDDFEWIEHPKQILEKTTLTTDLAKGHNSEEIQEWVKTYVNQIITSVVAKHSVRVTPQPRLPTPRDSDLQSTDSDTPILTPEEDAFLTTLLGFSETSKYPDTPTNHRFSRFDPSSSDTESVKSFESTVQEESTDVSEKEITNSLQQASPESLLEINLPPHKVTINLHKAMELGIITSVQKLSLFEQHISRRKALAKYGRNLLWKSTGH